MALAGLAALVGLAHWPVTTRVGINYQVSRKRMPLYEKAIDFASRDLQTRRLVREVTAGSSSQEDRLVKILAWITEHMHPMPEGFDVVDDHPFHILIRSYGAEDQRTEAFALLAGYAGMPTEVFRARPTGAPHELTLAVVQCGKRRVILDVVNRVIFRRPDGQLADLPEILEDPRGMARLAPVPTVDGVAYWRYLETLKSHSKLFTRTPWQQWWPRLWWEFQRLTGGRNG